MSALKRIVLPEIDPEVVQREIEDFLIDRIVGAGLRGGVLGLSGGIDSATVAFVAALAFKRYNSENPAAPQLKLIGLALPSDTNHPEHTSDAEEIGRILEIEVDVVPIQEHVDLLINRLGKIVEERHHRGNLASEMRAIVISRYAAANHCMVLGTGNRDEDYCLGYFTKRGDGAVDISPIGSLSKRLVRKLASHMGVPEHIVHRVPTAGLWHGQTDEGELGFTYELAEIVIAGYDLGMDHDEIAAEAECSCEMVDRILSMHKRHEHKMSMPEIAPVTSLA